MWISDVIGLMVNAVLSGDAMLSYALESCSFLRYILLFRITSLGISGEGILFRQALVAHLIFEPYLHS